MAKAKKRNTRKKATRRPARVRVRHHQWEMAAGFVADGSRLATLREVISPHVATVEGRQLSADQRIEITAHRISAQEQFRFGALGAGVIEKDRAIQEVRAGTPLGQVLVAIEHRAIEFLREEAERRRRNRARANRRSRRSRTRKSRRKG